MAPGGRWQDATGPPTSPTSSRGEQADAARKKEEVMTRRIAAMLCTLAAALPLAGGDWRDTPARSGPDAGEQRGGLCRSAVSGHVRRRVGNVLHGPSHLAGVPRISVRLLDSDGRLVSETRTDRDGAYALIGVCERQYTICPGTPCPTGPAIPSRFAPETRTIRVPPASRAQDFRLLDPPPPDIDAPFPAH
jgi:hypothetical protein